MAVYAVFEPPARGGDPLRHAERVAFVRDGFTWSAFLFGPLWMLRHRLWLAFVAYIVLFALLGWAEYDRRVPAGGETVIWIMLAVLIGLEAATLRRRKLLRWRWRDAGIVVADDLEAAEQRYFDRRIALPSPALASRGRAQNGSPPAAARQAYAADGDVIGMFPPPGGIR